MNYAKANMLEKRNKKRNTNMRERERERWDLVLGYGVVEGVEESGIVPQVAFLSHFYSSVCPC